MKIHYYPETDTLSIELKSGVSAQTEAINDHVTLDLDVAGSVISLDIEQASRCVDLSAINVAGGFGQLTSCKAVSSSQYDPSSIVGLISADPNFAECSEDWLHSMFQQCLDE